MSVIIDTTTNRSEAGSITSLPKLMMIHSFIQIPMSELRVKLPKIRRLVQLGKQRVVVTYYGEIVGFLLPLDDIDLNPHIPISKTEEMPLTKFRDQLTESWEIVQQEVDCIYLTFHTRRILVFASNRLAPHLSLPMIGDANKILFLSTSVEKISV
jgi:hypothetical protein